MNAEKQKRQVQLLSAFFFFALLFWGGYGTIVYFGVPVHGSVLLSDAVRGRITGICDNQELICRGWRTIVPAVMNTVVRAKPFMWYGIVSVLLYAVFLAWRWFQTGAASFRLVIRPYGILLGFLASVWLLLTVLSFTDNGNHSFRWLFEPVEQVYTNVTEDGLLSLRENYEHLQEKGCLRLLGTTNHGAKVFWYSTWCVQKGFFSAVFPLFLLAVFFLFELLILGHALLRRLHLKIERPLVEAMLSMGLGAYGWIAIIWLLAVVSQATPFSLLTAGVGWALVCIIPLLCYRSVLYFWRLFIRHQWEFSGRWSNPSVLFLWLLMSYLALNFLSVIRPFPIGWDDLGSYLNRPRLMVSYGHFIYSMAPFQWEYLTSIGYVLFGYDSTFATTAAMVINWAAGLLAAMAVFLFANVFLGRGAGLLSALLYYTLPLVGHFSFADMKIDNAVFAMGALSTFALFLYLFPPNEFQSSSSKKLLLLSGVFGGLAFAMKPTAIMVMMSLGAILFAALFSWPAFVAAVFFVFGIFAFRGQLGLGVIAERIFGDGADIPRMAFVFICAIVGIAFLAMASYRSGRDRNVRAFGMVLIFVVAFFLSIEPWVIHNNIQRGDSILLGFPLSAPNKVTPMLSIRYPDYTGSPDQTTLSLPSDLQLDPHHPACEETGHKEELDRYWGFGKGIRHYMTLPWRSVMNLDSAGYYVTTIPALLLFPLLLLLPFLWLKQGRWALWLLWGTFLILLQWMFLANGIPWYGIGVFLGLCVGLEVLVRHAPDTPSRVLAGILITLSLVVAFANRFWQYEQQRNLLEYPMGKVSALAMRERTIPYYDDIRKYVMARYASMPDRPYLYRVGTFIPYFIPRNLEVIGLTDHQLDQFNCLYQERDTKLTLKRLKALGFNSIIFDTNTATIEKEINGTLHQKVTAFVDFLNTPELGLSVVVNDPGRGVAFILIP